MNVTFRRDDGREFVFEMPDGLAVVHDGRAFLDATVYRSIGTKTLMVASSDCEFGLLPGDMGFIVGVGEPFRAEVESLDFTLSRQGAVKVSFRGRTTMTIPPSEIKEWLNK